MLLSTASTVVLAGFLGVVSANSKSDEGLVVQYEFSEGTGSELHDSSGNGLDGRIVGAKWVRVGQEHFALQFDGEDDYLDLGHDPRLDIKGPISLEAWIMPEQVPLGGDGFIMGRGPGSFAMTYSGTGYPARVYWHVAEVKKMSRAKAFATIWHHVVATYDGSRLRIYLDGAVQGGVRAWKHEPGPPDQEFRIGGGVAGLLHFKGQISGVRVYKGSMGQQEAFSRYQAARASYPVQTQPQKESWSGQGVKGLNNLVAEVARIDGSEDDSQPTEVSFTNPRDGWIFVTSTASIDQGDSIRIILNDDKEPIILHNGAGSGPVEAMRHLPAGKHFLRISTEGVSAKGKGSLKELVVRAIPELMYGAYPGGPLVTEFDSYTWDYLQRDILPNATTIVGLPSEDEEKHVKQWKASGRKWIAEHSAGWYDNSKASETEDDFFRVLTTKPGMQHPLMDGVLLDTHDVNHSNTYKPYAQAVSRVCQDHKFRDKDLYLYCDALYGAPASEFFAQSALDNDCRLVWTAYLHEQATEVEAASFMESVLVGGAVGWEKRFPGSLKQTILALGYLTSPAERMDVNPGTNYLVLMDMQCQLIATNPAFRGLAGVMWYKASYANDEPHRWAGRLFRHYFIEGKTTLLSSDPYELDHLQNPDFDQDTKGWNIKAADSDSVKASYLDRYGFVQGRWLETGPGDNFLLMRRSKKGPNSFSQTIRNLEPGRLYSMKLYTTDMDRLLDHTTTQEKHAVSIDMDGVELIAEKSFQYPYPSFSYYHLGPYDDEEPAYRNWSNLHHHVFRAKGTTAQLTVSDWLGSDDPGGPIGQGLMYNFVEVQPYLE